MANEEFTSNQYVTLQYYPNVSNYINGGLPINVTMGLNLRMLLYQGEGKITPENVYELIADQANGEVAQIDFT